MGLFTPKPKHWDSALEQKYAERMSCPAVIEVTWDRKTMTRYLFDASKVGQRTPPAFRIIVQAMKRDAKVTIKPYREGM
jgi:hypothetical protein